MRTLTSRGYYRSSGGKCQSETRAFGKSTQEHLPLVHLHTTSLKRIHPDNHVFSPLALRDLTNKWKWLDWKIITPELYKLFDIVEISNKRLKKKKKISCGLEFIQCYVIGNRVDVANPPLLLSHALSNPGLESLHPHLTTRACQMSPQGAGCLSHRCQDEQPTFWYLLPAATTGFSVSSTEPGGFVRVQDNLVQRWEDFKVILWHAASLQLPKRLQLFLVRILI